MFLTQIRHRLPLLAHNRNYRWLWTSTIFSSFDEMLSFTAVTLYVLNLTGSGAALAGAWAVQTLPAMVAGSISGVLADRYNRRLIWLIAGSITAAAYALYAFAQTIEQFFVLIAIASFCLTVARNAYLAMLPDVVAEGELVDANALTAMNFNIALTTAPLLAGALVAASGAQVAFGLLAVLQLGGLFAISRVRYTQNVHHDPHPDGWLGDLRAGLHYARGHATVRHVLITALGVHFGGGALIILEALLVKQVLNAGDAGYGLLLSCAGLGAILGSLLMKPLTARWSILRVFTVAVIVTGFTYYPYAMLLWFPVTLLIVFAQTITFAMVMVLVDTIIQAEASGAQRGRMLGLSLVVRNGMTLFAMAALGPLVEPLGTLNLLFVAGTVYMLAGIYAAFTLWRVRPAMNVAVHDALAE
ncbi:MAG: MFS transporter [Chloroflexi bacterium]|nr:MFS transporter [Chloroflexota bacterium]